MHTPVVVKTEHNAPRNVPVESDVCEGVTTRSGAMMMRFVGNEKDRGYLFKYGDKRPAVVRQRSTWCPPNKDGGVAYGLYAGKNFSINEPITPYAGVELHKWVQKMSRNTQGPEEVMHYCTCR